MAKKTLEEYLNDIGKDPSLEARRSLSIDKLNDPDYQGTQEEDNRAVTMLMGGAVPGYEPITKPKNAFLPTGTNKPAGTNPGVGANVQSQSLPGATAPMAYESPYTTQIDSILKNIMGGQQFSYNAASDPLYQQYNDKFTKNADLSMRDTMGNASALTGGYGSSYAGTVGQQAYDAQMGQLNDVMPELYNAAYGRFQDERNNQYNNLSALQGLDQQAYGAYRDTVGDYQTDRSFNHGVEQDALSQKNTDRQFEYNKSLDEIDQMNYEEATAYQKKLDKLLRGDQINQRDYDREMDKLEQKNYEKEVKRDQSNTDRSFSYQQSQDAQDQKNYENEVAYDKEQDVLNRQAALDKYVEEQTADMGEKEAKASAEKIQKYSKKVESMLSKDDMGESKNTIEETLDYLMSQNLTDEEIAEIVNENYELSGYTYPNTDKGYRTGVSPSGRTHSSGGRSLY